MFKGRIAIVYSAMKVAIFAAAFFEYLLYYEMKVPVMLFAMISIFIANNFLRQFLLNDRRKLYWYEWGSIILEFILGVYIASLLPVGPVVILLTPSIFELMANYNPLFGAGISLTVLAALIGIDIMDTLHSRWIYNFYVFFQRVLAQYALGYVFILVISYLASLQFKERERIAKVNHELEEAYRQLLDNASKLQELSIEKERNRMAREIHDTLAHTLTAAIVQMEAVRKLIDIDSSKAKAEIGKAQEVTRTGLAEVKRTIKALRPRIMENSSLCDAIRNLIQSTEDSTDVKVEFHDNLKRDLEIAMCSDTELSSGIEVVIFRIIQESITNAIRHGAADKVCIFMTENEGILHIDIRDNGKGCARIKEGYGLKGITERVRGLNGTVHFSSATGKGFHTDVAIPI